MNEAELKKAKTERTRELMAAAYDTSTYRFRMNSLFLDSGAHSLYAQKVLSDKKTGRKLDDPYAFYRTDEFYQYVDAYCEYVKANRQGIQHFVTVDAIFNPELTWDIQQYIERKFKIVPVPVIHFGTSIEWIQHYVDRGHKLIGLGGLGQEVTTKAYFKWADMVYEYLCPESNGFRPVVKTHGFAMTGWHLLMRYPWWSVDSASWTKAGAFGTVYVPRLLNGDWTFTKPPLAIATSLDSPYASKFGKAYHTLTKADRRVLDAWIEYCGQSVGAVDKDGLPTSLGVTTHHNPRKICNLKFFELMRDKKELWPQTFEQQRSAWSGRGFDASDDKPEPPEARHTFKPEKFRIYFSGNSTPHSSPEQVLSKTPPNVMLTYYEIHEKKCDTALRAEKHYARCRKLKAKKAKQ